MFADLRLWSEVERFAAENGSLDLRDLMIRHAKWSEEVPPLCACVYACVSLSFSLTVCVCDCVCVRMRVCV